MKSSTKSSIRNIFAVLILGGSAVFFGRLFWNELTFNVENQSGILVGEVVDIRGQAQRRFENQSRWGSLKGSEAVYNLDAIRTESDSGAVIVLKTTDDAGTERFDEISLGPNTYIVLDLRGRERNIRFVGGNLSATAAAGLTVSADNTSVSFDNGEVNLSREDGTETSVSVNRGQALVRSSRGETTVGTNAVLHVNEESGETRRDELALNTLSPDSNALLLSYSSEREVIFRWELFENWEQSAVELSRTPDFAETTVSDFRSPGNTQVSLRLGRGNWFWRVIGKENGQQGRLNSFSIDQEKEIRPLSPANDTVFPFRSVVVPVSLLWEPAWYADSYTVELGNDEDLANPLIVKNVNSGSLLLDTLSAGDWWWRITPVYRRALLDESPVSATRKFSLEQRSGYPPTELLSPPDGFSFSALDVRDGINFRWKNDVPVNSYTLSVSDTPDFERIIASAEGPDPLNTLLPAAESGRYWWRVETVSVGGEPIPVSAVRSFSIRGVEGSVNLVSPKGGEVLEQEPYTPYDFVWETPVPGTIRYQLYRVADSGRTKLIESLVQGNSFTVPLPGEGDYAWKIQILDTRGRMLVESPEERFRLQSEFFSPVLRSPAPGSSLNLVGTDRLTLLWDPVPEADAYSLELSGPGGQIIGRDNRIPSTERSFALPETALEGEYTVKLSSIRDNPPAAASRSSRTAIYSFRIAERVQYSPAQPQSPANNSSFGRLESLRNPIRLSWTQNPSLGRWTVELSKGRLTRLYQTTENSLVLENLDEGSYSWKVLSRDGFGREAPESPTFRFRILSLPSLPSPVVLLPSSGQTLDMTRARSLNFDWQDVRDADYYDLTLYIQGEDVPILRETGLRSTSYVLDNLDILDVGDFRLELKARSEYPDIGLSRDSAPSVVPFSLTLNIGSGAPRILSDELQYAE